MKLTSIFVILTVALGLVGPVSYHFSTAFGRMS